MRNYKLTTVLRNLSKEGDKLLRSGKTSVQEEGLALWLATASDVLRISLPDDSALLNTFEKAAHISEYSTNVDEVNISRW